MSAYSDAILAMAQPPRHYWPMNGPAVADAVVDLRGVANLVAPGGAANPAVVRGPNLGETGTDTALQWDGVDDGLSVPFDFSDVAQISYEMLVYWRGNHTNDNRRLFAAPDHYVSPHGNIANAWERWNVSMGAGWAAVSNPPDQWAHIVVQLDRTLTAAHDAHRTWINGGRESRGVSQNNPAMTGNFPAGTLWLGRNSVGGEFAIMRLAHLAIYPRLITAAEIRDHVQRVFGLPAASGEPLTSEKIITPTLTGALTA
jgi:hypothetical protein